LISAALRLHIVLAMLRASMRIDRTAIAIAFAAALSACDHHEVHSGPAGLPYDCGDGRLARIFYEGGGDPARARARLLFEGRSFEMAAAPAMTGLRYVSESGLAPGRSIAWAAEGEGAVISESEVDPASASADREIARCTRLREGEAAEAREDHPIEHH
jgi:hypothetical protein